MECLQQTTENSISSLAPILGFIFFPQIYCITIGQADSNLRLGDHSVFYPPRSRPKNTDYMVSNLTKVEVLKSIDHRMADNC